MTGDSLFNGKLVVRQSREGYRFSIDAVLLAGLTAVKPCERVMDLGAGCGVVPLILAYRNLGREFVGVEIQETLAELAETNVAANGFSDRIAIRRMDLREAKDCFDAGSFDLVVSNPPYRRLETGRVNRNGQRAVARHEISASVSDVFDAANHLLPVKGRLAVIYPAPRLDHLIAAARGRGFSPKRLTVIYSNAASPARLVHLESRKGGGEELFVAPPFFIYGERGQYSEAMKAFYDG